MPAGSVSAFFGAVKAAVDRADAPTRLLLLARTAGVWRHQQVEPSPRLAVLADNRILLDHALHR